MKTEQGYLKTASFYLISDCKDLLITGYNLICNADIHIRYLKEGQQVQIQD